MLDTLKGSRITSIVKGHGSFLIVEFEDRDNIGISRAVSLWIYLCDWRLKNGNKTIIDAVTVSPQSSFEFMLNSVLENYAFTKDTSVFELRFSNNIKIIVRPDLCNYDIDDDLIMLTISGGETFGYSPGKGWQC